MKKVVALTLAGMACFIGSMTAGGGAMSGALTLLGFFVGLLVGFELKDAQAILHDSRQGELHMPHPHPVAAMRRLHLPEGFLMYVIAVLLAGVGLMLTYVLIDFQSYQRCMSNWQQQSAQALQVRLDAAVDKDAAMDGIILAVSNNDRAALDKAVGQYIEVRQLQTEERERNPLPPLPDTVCGEIK